MCLTNIQHNEPLITTEGIFVYKVLIENNGILTTPFMHRIIEIGTSYVSDFTELIEHDHNYFSGTLYKLEQGLHSLKTVGEAFSVARDLTNLISLNNNYCVKFIIARCLIPKRTKYYKGLYQIGRDECYSFCSQRIKYLEIVKP